MGIFDRVFSQLGKEKPPIEVTPPNKRLLAQINQYASLIRLQDERQLIEVITPDHRDSFQTMIVGVDLYQQQLIIDEFSPQLHNPEALIGKAIKLRHQSQSNRKMLELVSDVLGWDEESNCFLLELPDHVNYQPRRQDFRLEMTGGQVFKAIVDPIYGAPWYASISNISLGGMRILVTGDLRDTLHKHKPLRNCELTLDGGQIINTRGRVKSFSYFGRPYRRTEISIAFEGMSEEEQSVLEEFIAQFSIAA